MKSWTKKEYSIFSKGRVTAVEKLLATGHDINAVDADNGYSGLFYAVDNGNFPVVQCLLKHGANPNLTDIYGQTPLHFAVDLAVECAIDYWSVHSIAIIGLLLTKGASPKAADQNGRTPLDWAKEKDYETAVKLMEKFL